MFFSCADLAVPHDIMHHVVRVESSGNPYAIGVVGGRLQRQPKNLAEAVATAKMLEQKGFNFSLGLAQVNRYNLKKIRVAFLRTCIPSVPKRQGRFAYIARMLQSCKRLG